MGVEVGDIVTLIPGRTLAWVGDLERPDETFYKIDNSTLMIVSDVRYTAGNPVPTCELIADGYEGNCPLVRMDHLVKV